MSCKARMRNVSIDYYINICINAPVDGDGFFPAKVMKKAMRARAAADALAYFIMSMRMVFRFCGYVFLFRADTLLSKVSNNPAYKSINVLFFV